MRAPAGITLLAAVLLLSACQALATKSALRSPPYVVAHRGLSGVYPEHTLRAYKAAVEAGADFIECDVVPTKDCQLICRHEPELTLTTDASAKFPGMVRSYNIDGYNATGIFSFDLTLAEVKTLRAKQPSAIRDPSFNGKFFVPTLEEYIQVAQSYPRAVGIYPETKHPSFHDSLGLACFKGKSFSEAVVDILNKHGYTAAVGSKAWRQKPAFIQSFERKNLLALAAGKKTKLPLVFLTDEFDTAIPYEKATYGQVLNNDAALKQLQSAGVRGIGPWKNTLVAYTADNHLDTSTIPAGKKMVQRLHKAGFQIHLYTLRNEPKRPDGSGYLPFDFRADPYLEYDLLFKELGVDGAFTDQAHTLARYFGKHRV